jgi:hypothetical protein
MGVSASATMQYSNENTNAHGSKKKKLKKEKSRYSVTVLAASQTPPRQHLKSRFFKSDTSKKEIFTLK